MCIVRCDESKNDVGVISFADDTEQRREEAKRGSSFSPRR
jgi:hypothetical protein